MESGSSSTPQLPLNLGRWSEEDLKNEIDNKKRALETMGPRLNDGGDELKSFIISCEQELIRRKRRRGNENDTVSILPQRNAYTGNFNFMEIVELAPPSQEGSPPVEKAEAETFKAAADDLLAKPQAFISDDDEVRLLTALELLRKAFPGDKRLEHVEQGKSCISDYHVCHSNIMQLSNKLLPPEEKRMEYDDSVFNIKAVEHDMDDLQEDLCNKLNDITEVELTLKRLRTEIDKLEVERRCKKTCSGALMRNIVALNFQRNKLTIKRNNLGLQCRNLRLKLDCKDLEINELEYKNKSLRYQIEPLLRSLKANMDRVAALKEDSELLSSDIKIMENAQKDVDKDQQSLEETCNKKKSQALELDRRCVHIGPQIEKLEGEMKNEQTKLEKWTKDASEMLKRSEELENKHKDLVVEQISLVDSLHSFIKESGFK